MSLLNWNELQKVLKPIFKDREPRWNEVFGVLINLYQGDSRPDWDEFFLGVVESLRIRSTCDRGRTASVIVKDNKILTTGYAGSLSGFPHCDEAGHLIWKIIDDQGHESSHCFRTLHAEENAILQAAEFGISVKGATLYCMMSPCHQRCARLVVRAGICRVVSKRRYHADKLSIQMFKDANVEFKCLEQEVQKYQNQ